MVWFGSSNKTQAAASTPLPPPAEAPPQVETIPLLGDRAGDQQGAQLGPALGAGQQNPSGYATSTSQIPTVPPSGLASGYSSSGLQPLQGGLEPLQSNTTLQPLNASLEPLNSSSQVQTLPLAQGQGPGLPPVAESAATQPAPSGSTQPAPSTQAKTSTPVVPVGQVMIQEIKAEGLKLKDAVCKSATCTSELGLPEKPHSKWTSPIAKNITNPAWAPSYVFETFNQGDTLSFTIVDKASYFGQTKLGKISLAFEKFYPAGYYGKVRLTDGVKDAKPLVTVKVLVKPTGDTQWHVPETMDSPLDLEPLATSTGAATTQGTGGTTTRPDLDAVNKLMGSQSAPDLAAVDQSRNPPPLGVNSSTAPLGSTTAPLGVNSSTEALIGSGAGTGPGSTMGLSPLVGPSTGETGVGSIDGKTPPVVAPDAFALKETQQKEAWNAIARWLKYWQLRRSVQLDPAREKNKAFLHGAQQGIQLSTSGQDRTTALLQGAVEASSPPAQDRMFVFKIRNAVDISIPLSADSRVPKSRWAEVRKVAEKEAASALSLRLRFSFLDAPAGLGPAIYGHSILSPKLRIQKAETFQADAAPTSCFGGAAGGLGKLNVTAQCDPLPPFFFCSNTAGSDRQLVVEVLAEMEPLVADMTTIPERGHTILIGESIRVRADGWLRSREKASGQIGGGIAFIVDLKTASGNVALRWAPLLNGEQVMRNAVVNGAWSTPDLHGGWPHHSTPPAPGGQGGPVVLDFRRLQSGWEVWVDGYRQPEFDFQDRSAPIDVVGADFSGNLQNAEVSILPASTTNIRAVDKLPQGTTSRTQYLKVANRQWSVDSGVAATVRPKATPKGRSTTASAAQNKSQIPTALIGTQEPITVGWMCVRFDNATETFSTFKEQLILGSLQEWLLPYVDPNTGQPKQSTNKLQDYLQRVQGQRTVGGMDYDLWRVQTSPVAQKLLPLDFTACVGMSRLGGIASNMDKGFLALSAADEAECLLKDFCVTFPDNTWLEDFKKAVEFNVNGRMDSLPGDQKQIQELYLKVGSHNCLRWLKVQHNDPNTGLSRLQPGMGVDESRHTWKLNLEDTGQMNYMFRGGSVPLDFACDVDCALVFELAATVTASKTGTAEKTQKQTIGWLLLLPLVHTTEEALLKATDIYSLSQPTIQYNMELMQQMDPISGQKAFRWKPVAAGQQPLHNAVRISFGISSDAFIKWLQRKCSPILVPEELKPRPRSQQLTQLPSPLPGMTVGSQIDKTSDLLRPPSQDMKAVSALVSPQSTMPVPSPGMMLPSPGLMPSPQPPWVHPATTQTQPGVSMPPPELQTVVERIYLRDQGTQSDPPPIPGMEDCMISEGRALPAAAVAALASPASPEKDKPYTGPSMRPLPGGTAARLIQDVGDAGASNILRGVSYLKGAGPRRELRWRLEDDDPLQADEVTVEFLAYRSFTSASAERVHFQLRFFVFPPLKTSSAVLAGGVGEACMLRSAVTNDRLALVYNIDGATKGSASQVHRQLAEYLAARSAEVEVWSTDSVMQVGAATIPLEPLVRQGQQVTKVEGEFPVLDPMTGETRGSLQMLLACRGRVPSRAVPGAGQPPLVPGAGQPPLQSTMVNSMVPEVSEVGASVTVPAGSATAAVREVQAERGRVRRHKAQVLLGTTPAPTAVPSAVDFLNDNAKKRHRLKQLRMIRGSSADITERFTEHTALLSAAEEVRADRKRAEVARRMDRFNTSQVLLPAAFAHSAFFHVEFANPYSQQATFIVSITEPQKPKPQGVVGPGTMTTSTAAVGVPSVVPQSAAANFQGILEQAPEEALVLVKDPTEWQRLVMDKKMPPPATGEYGIFSALGQFAMRPGEATSLPFRFLAFNHPSLATVAQQAPVGGMSLPEAEAQGQEVPDRIFVVEVLAQQGPPLKRVEVTVRAQPCVIDKTVRFFEAEGEPIEKSLALPVRPAAAGLLRGFGLNNTFLDNQSTLWQQSQAQAGFVSASVGRNQDRFVYCTDKEVHLQWKDDDTLQLRMLTPMSPAVRRFFVLCYSDANFMRVGAAQLVEVHAMKCEHVRVCVGQFVDRTISLPPVELLDTLTVQAFSSDPDLVAVRHAAAVDPRYGAKLALAITAMRAGTRTCRLHATDPMTRRRIAAFLLIIAADMPDVRMAHDITLPLNRPSRKHLKYTNETMRGLRYTVKSSDPALATVQTPELMLPPGDTRVIELLFHAYPGTMSYTAEVYLFIASEDRAIQETRLLQLTFT